MKHLVILGAGTAGTTVANRMRRRLPRGWKLTVIDPDPVHVYQPGLLFVPFGTETAASIQRDRASTILRGVDWVNAEVENLDAEAKQVVLASGEKLPYDLLVIATGTRIRPDMMPGLAEDGWRKTVHDFYTVEGAVKLHEALERFEGGRVVLNIAEMPIKCPVAPLEFLFLADHYFKRRGIRDKVEIVFATPLDGAFTRPIAAQALGGLLVDKGIEVEPEFNAMEVDPEARILRSFDEREVPYDLLVSIPTHTGAQVIKSAGLGNELDFVPTDRHTLAAKNLEDVFVLGDATDLPSSKAGSVAHFQAEVLEENLLAAMQGHALEASFDGHANCFVETGHGKALLIDFNYDVEPLPGKFPMPGVGPFSLLKESRTNHLGKLAFKFIYWNGLLKGRPLFVPTQMSMAGKQPVEPTAAAA